MLSKSLTYSMDFLVVPSCTIPGNLSELLLKHGTSDIVTFLVQGRSVRNHSFTPDLPRSRPVVTRFRLVSRRFLTEEAVMSSSQSTGTISMDTAGGELSSSWSEVTRLHVKRRRCYQERVGTIAGQEVVTKDSRHEPAMW